MYEQFYQLREKPFNMTPDPEFLFFTEKHKEAFAHLVYGIRERRGFIEITGEVGAGKTTICRALLNEFDADTKIALILNPFLSDLELLRAINEELYIDASGETKKQLLDPLNHYLIDQHAAGRNVVLVIDEAQNLPTETLEQIRIISNLETVKAKLIQIVLVGQPELRAKLSRPELRQLNQRITVRYHISPLSRSEAEDYIFHRLKVAGDEGRIEFTREAIDLIYKYTSGVPRMINILCDHALLSGYVFERFDIDVDLVKKARKEIEGKEFGRLKTWKERLVRHSLVYGVVAAVLLGLLGYFAGRQGLEKLWSPQPGVSLATERRIQPQPQGDAPGEAVPLSPSQNGQRPMPEAAPDPSSGEGDKSPIVLSAAPQEAIERENAAVEQKEQPPLQEVAVEVPSLPPVEVLLAIDDPPEGEFTEEGGAPPAAQEKLQEKEEAPPIVAAEPGRFDPNGVLRCSTVGETRPAALLTLTHLWIPDQDRLQPLFEQYGMDSQQEWMAEAFEPFGLTPVSWSTNLAMLRAIDLPAMAEVYGKALFTPSYVVVTTLDGERVNLADPLAGKRTVSQQQLGEMWFGRLTVLVPKSVKPKVVLGKGSRGEEVRLLQVRLKKLGLFEFEPNGNFGDYTLQQVKRFQRQNRIKIDGLVGLETNLVLFSRLAGADAPRLAASKSRESGADS